MHMLVMSHYDMHTSLGASCPRLYLVYLGYVSGVSVDLEGHFGNLSSVTMAQGLFALVAL